MTGVRDRANPVADSFKPYRWSASIDAVAERYGIAPETVLSSTKHPPQPGGPRSRSLRAWRG